jgi:hypothetical protein
MFNTSTEQVTEISILEFGSVCMAALFNQIINNLVKHSFIQAAKWQSFDQ